MELSVAEMEEEETEGERVESCSMVAWTTDSVGPGHGGEGKWDQSVGLCARIK